MNIPVLLEPIPAGFRASTGAPLNLTAEAPTGEEALAAIRGALLAKEAAGMKIVELPVSNQSTVRELIADMAVNPLFDEWVAATKECRRQREAEEVAAEVAAEEARKKSTPAQEPAA